MAPLWTGIARAYGWGIGGGGGEDAPPGQVEATGGNAVLTPGDGYKYHIFTSSGSFVVTNTTGVSSPLSANHLVGAGGG